ncbi:hypothetical protein [Mangrovivirga cuniculi]|uniref:Uncharacterized protein n=1 Tax=Mangrovivirga cuniculi TaxID=2715131 RepID=A0A4D7K1U4_9BACT|nr:hypothetical protein [Mangrovivirga cuniculi]QCK14844.1 hypothetical protein DCC35_08870 [Mangrovivirga cuniculi]
MLNLKIKNHFKLFFFLLIIFGLINCTDEDISKQTLEKKTLEERVFSAEILPGDISKLIKENPKELEGNLGSYLFIPIPTRKGYLKIAMNSSNEKIKILKLVEKRFAKEFADVNPMKDQTNVRMAPPEVHCTDWKPRGGANGGAIRYCYVKSFIFLTDWFEYCECGYCC